MGNKQSNEDHSKPLTEEKIREISRKTNLDKEDILKWHSEFLRDCPNGKLEKKLFVKIYRQSFPMGDATKFCKICFNAFDKDKSGYIDFYEFISTIGIFAKGNIEDKLKLAFDIYDYNADGYIEKKEAEQIVSAIFELYGESVKSSITKDQVSKLMKKLDTDKNGMISEEEFVNGCLLDEELRHFFAPNCE